MSLDNKALALATQVGLDIKAILASIGDITQLTTTNKTSIVNAINDLQAGYQAVLDLQTANNATIDDKSTSTTSGWSADKIITALADLKVEIIDGAPTAFDTLKEISVYLNNNDLTITNLLNLLMGTVRYDAAQTLSDVEQQQACNNIGIGNKDILVRDEYLVHRDTNTYIQPGYLEPGYFA